MKRIKLDDKEVKVYKNGDVVFHCEEAGEDDFTFYSNIEELKKIIEIGE